MRFAELELLWLFLLLPVLAAFAWLGALGRRKALERFAGGPPHRNRFTVEVSPHRRAAKVLLLLLAFAAGVVTAARPQWGIRLEPVTRRGVDIALAIDTSQSMAAQDVPPDRLGQARHAASSLLGRLGGDRVALVSFAGQAALDCPLTPDPEAVKLFLDVLDVEAVAVPGTALGEAMRVAGDALRRASTGQEERGQVVVLFSDGEDHEGGMEAAIRALKQAKAAVYAVGCGTTRGGPIPLKGAPGAVSGYKKDREGRVVTTRLDESVLQRLALDTGGRDFRATPAEVEVDEIAKSIAAMEAKETGTVLRTRFEERYQIPLAVALAALLAEAFLTDRRGGFRLRRGAGRSEVKA